jgi:hemoglobin
MNPSEAEKADPAQQSVISVPYKSTPIFDEITLPEKLRNAHSVKAGVWGIIRVLEGQLRYVIEDTGVETIITPDHPGLVVPEQQHHVEPIGQMKMQVEFYDHQPEI